MPKFARPWPLERSEPALFTNASAAIADSLLRQACQESKPTRGKVLLRCDLIERSGSSEAWYGGRARHSVPRRTDHPLQSQEQRVPGTPLPVAAERRVPIALLLQWVQHDATAGYPLLLGNARGGRDEPS